MLFRSVLVKAGENRGRPLVYHNVVRELSPIGMWNGSAQSIRLDRETLAHMGISGCAVLLQAGHGGRIIGAALLDRI